MKKFLRDYRAFKFQGRIDSEKRFNKKFFDLLRKCALVCAKVDSFTDFAIFCVILEHSKIFPFDRTKISRHSFSGHLSH